ncbi:pentatricopeptide repeat-containing protein [Cucumis melo var. makuwa]|uniref:Pentatricopeptide repeat-containing protein n=2 Tax=Cucumis melo TaxID=3656 RepID=A0A5A7UH59_CUCMM|nr:pentatricopeptide repeat-containing protein [Cucumis melo var. makuwa]TYK25537.1 pentatricopeptide repeat-containing protein [Cucumis melo var. makuwa]
MSVLYQISVGEICAKHTTTTLLSSFGRYAFLLCNLHNSILSSQFSTCQVVPKISSPVRDFSANSNVARSNWLITKLGKEGKIREARKVFEEMLDRDVVSWTAVITGYIKCGMIEEAKTLFDRNDAIKNVVTWTALVSGYVKLNRIEEARRLFDAMPVKNVVSWNTMIEGYARKGWIDQALDLFEKMPERNVVSWNTVITALMQRRRVDEAQALFNRMPERDVISWTTMVAGLSKNGRIDDARLLFDKMPVRNVVSWNAIIIGYAQNMRLDEAFKLFEQMPERELSSWNTMITGFIQNGKLERAVDLFYKMSNKNVVTWTAVISGHVQDGRSEEALKIFSEMQAANNVKPNEGTFVSVLGACSKLAVLCEGQQIHQVISKTVYQEVADVVSALINMYSKCGELELARKIFDDGSIDHRDVVSWNGMIAAYAHHGHGHKAICLFDEMQALGFRPDNVTYIALLSACSHAGLVDEGLKLFENLLRDRSIKLREDHFTCLVDLFGRAGRLQEAFDFINGLEVKPSTSVWAALLAGCNVHGHIDLGKLTAEKLLETEPENAGTFLVLSNIYASTGKWREAAGVRMKMKDKGLKKQPGCSWIEVGNTVHVFVVGDNSYREFENIYRLLHDLHTKMKKIGHILYEDLTMDFNLVMA